MAEFEQAEPREIEELVEKSPPEPPAEAEAVPSEEGVEFVRPVPLPVELVEEERMRFGLAAMLLLMSLCSVQFAAIFYLGPLGSVLGMLLPAVVLLGVAIWAEVQRHAHGAFPVVPLESRLGRWFPLIMLLAIVACAVLGVGQVAVQEFHRYTSRQQTARELGFTFSIEQNWRLVSSTYEADWVVKVESVEAGGAFDLAGIKAGEMILFEGEPDDVFAHLQMVSGQSCELTVSESNWFLNVGGANPVQTKRTVTVTAP